jgi:hypothetical protein
VNLIGFAVLAVRIGASELIMWWRARRRMGADDRGWRADGGWELELRIGNVRDTTIENIA